MSKTLHRKFYAFCAKQPPERAYDYDSCDKCALGQFLATQGVDTDWFQAVYCNLLPGARKLDAIASAKSAPNVCGSLNDSERRYEL